ncbi:Sugar phosphate isomerase/epimerase [Candidatus Koribacter versatilis Ellin345]|uniref:Sugar phosphate isomerase/epimerase n=1 Tax=Koribacter versatilis (strain Ellin345) TaxID=204669 RepID=Q1III8_KORVE|nr:sugar phosphate isomerase/epimerase [Candidatus Koribacter versatilis]ABF43312.1 Sugar phosphate isomerase/epimerase [Candidatus Koribacter versatilis Ellin345]
MPRRLSRRDLLRNAAVGAVAFGPASRLMGQTKPTNHSSAIKLGIASYTFRNFSRAQLIGYLKQLNIKSLNAKDAKDHLPSDPQQEAAAVADYRAAGIELHAAGAIYFPKNDDADIRAKFDYCKRAGIPVLVAGDPTVEELTRLEHFAKEYDIRVAIHNHGPEDKIFPSPLEVLKAVKDLDPRMGCCIDVGHTVRTGTDVVQAIRLAGTRLFNVHMKDLTSVIDKESQVAVGDGILPIRAIFEALLAIKYTGFVDLEYEVHADDPMPGVIASLAYMRGMLDGMA